MVDAHGQSVTNNGLIQVKEEGRTGFPRAVRAALIVTIKTLNNKNFDM